MKSKISLLNVLVIFCSLIFICVRLVYSSGMLTPDSIEYLKQADNFWEYKINFPLGYPLAIKIASCITGSLYTASKLVNLFSYLGIIIFSYRKKFYFSQTLIVFTCYPFIDLYAFTISEPLYFFINYLVIYIIHQIIQHGFTARRSVILAILFFLLISLRFSGIFIVAVSIIFLAYDAYKKRITWSSFLNTALLSASGGFLYITINYLYCGYMLGERNHLTEEYADFFTVFIPNMMYSVGKDFSIFNIILHKAILTKISFLNGYVGLGMIFSAFLYAVMKRKSIPGFSIYLLFGFTGILVSLFYSYYTTYIDNTIRIKSNAYLYLFMFIVINLPKKTVGYIKIIITIILIFNSITVLIYSENINTFLSRYEKIIGNISGEKKIHIIYKNSKDKNERNNARLLLFKAILIDKGYRIIESDSISDHTSEYYVPASHITGTK